jgi:hypothetical protein
MRPAVMHRRHFRCAVSVSNDTNTRAAWNLSLYAAFSSSWFTLYSRTQCEGGRPTPAQLSTL